MNKQASPLINLTLSLDEVNALISIVARAPLPYNTSHPLITKMVAQLRGEGDQSATQPDGQLAQDDAREHED